MSQRLTDCQQDQVHQIAQTTILAMFMRGFCIEAVASNDAVKKIVLSYTVTPTGSDDLQLSFVGLSDEFIAGFEI